MFFFKTNLIIVQKFGC